MLCLLKPTMSNKTQQTMDVG